MEERGSGVPKQREGGGGRDNLAGIKISCKKEITAESRVIMHEHLNLGGEPLPAKAHEDSHKDGGADRPAVSEACLSARNAVYAERGNLLSFSEDDM